MDVYNYFCTYSKVYVYLCEFSMNLNKIQPKNETEDLLISITKKYETLIKQTHRKPVETREFKMIKPRATFPFNPPTHIKGDWMIGLIDLEVYSSIFNITEEHKNIELHTDTFDELSFEELKVEVEENLNIPNITEDYLEYETIGPRIIKTYWKLRSEKSSTDSYNILLRGYARAPFRDFGSYLRIVVGLDEDDIQLILQQNNSNFVTYQLSPGIYTFEDVSKAVYTMGDHEVSLKNE